MAVPKQPQLVQPEMQPWSISFEAYSPIEFTGPNVLTVGVKEGWADPEDLHQVNFSQLPSYEGSIGFDDNGRPLNPRGRTGKSGRHTLGKWGWRNRAADTALFAPIGTGELVVELIQRDDTKEWALPGGMVNDGEDNASASRRELSEESGVNTNEIDLVEVYRGYVDDPRNTDNAWIETVVFAGLLDAIVKLTPGDDAQDAKWVPVEKALREPTYANHGHFIALALSKLRNS